MMAPQAHQGKVAPRELLVPAGNQDLLGLAELLESMAPDPYEGIIINGHRWEDVANKTCSGPIYTMEEARALSYWPYKAITTGGKDEVPKEEA